MGGVRVGAWGDPVKNVGLKPEIQINWASLQGTSLRVPHPLASGPGRQSPFALRVSVGMCFCDQLTQQLETSFLWTSL